jgi:hypothetical protein
MPLFICTACGVSRERAGACSLRRHLRLIWRRSFSGKALLVMKSCLTVFLVFSMD